VAARAASGRHSKRPAQKKKGSDLRSLLKMSSSPLPVVRKKTQLILEDGTVFAVSATILSLSTAFRRSSPPPGLSTLCQRRAQHAFGQVGCAVVWMGGPLPPLWRDGDHDCPLRMPLGGKLPCGTVHHTARSKCRCRQLLSERLLSRGINISLSAPPPPFYKHPPPSFGSVLVLSERSLVWEKVGGVGG
jgi:hypothetical protein